MLLHVFSNHSCKYLITGVKASDWTVVSFIAQVFSFWQHDSSSLGQPIWYYFRLFSPSCEASYYRFPCTFKLFPPEVLYSIDPWVGPVFPLFDYVVKILFSDRKFLHIFYFFSYLLCNSIHPFSVWGLGFILPDTSPEFFKLFHIRYFSS